MKRYFTSLLSSVFVIACSAQTMNVHFKNGTKVQFCSEIVDYVDFSEKPTAPKPTAGEYVDLGLSVKWASCNLGATKPSETGGLYAWGETSTKNEYAKDNYAYYDSSTSAYTDIGHDISGSQYDAATVQLGKNWRIPSNEEYRELYNNCKWEWSSLDGVYGYTVKGPNGNIVFFPVKSHGRGEYWTSNSTSLRDLSYALFFSKDEIGFQGEFEGCRYKYYGLAIRPVYSPSSSDGISNITEYISIARTGISTSVQSNGTVYKVTFEIKNNSTETIHLSSLGGIDINTNLEGRKSYSITLQSSTAALQNYQQTLIFTYNGKSYSIKG
ncbi:hypothetical protein [Hallella colorans]|uniref:hypothetical protein n=1 Tax=Hallella colorans TaxID=1703337 RepID=UPI0023F0F068|nr:hypothetical protein [Hallella colorans]